MYCLGIDTSAAVGSVAVTFDDAPLCHQVISTNMTHSVNILPAMQKVITEAGISLKQLNAVAVGVGPGSYTGVRVGIAFAKGIAFGLKIPIAGVCSFESMLYAHKGFDGAICTLVDAKMGGTYWGAYRWNSNEIITLNKPSVSRTEDINFQSDNKILFLSPDIEKFMGTLRPKFSVSASIEFKEAFPDATYIAILGAKRLSEKDKHPEIKLEPYYLRPSMAEMTSLKKQERE